MSHRYHSISISAFFCVLIASSLLCAPGGNRLDQVRQARQLKRNLFLLRFYRTHVTIIIVCI